LYNDKLSFEAYPKNGVKSFNSYITFKDDNIKEINSELIMEKEKE
jgi:hypothetical protein